MRVCVACGTDLGRFPPSARLACPNCGLFAAPAASAATFPGTGATVPLPPADPVITRLPAAAAAFGESTLPGFATLGTKTPPSIKEGDAPTVFESVPFERRFPDAKHGRSALQDTAIAGSPAGPVGSPEGAVGNDVPAITAARRAAHEPVLKSSSAGAPQAPQTSPEFRPSTVKSAVASGSRREERPTGRSLPAGYSPLEELGATLHHGAALPARPVKPVKRSEDIKRRLGPAGLAAPDKRIGRSAPKVKPKSSRQTVALIIAAVLGLTAVLAVILWPKPMPVTAAVRAADGGGEALDLTCASCPDGTSMSTALGEGTVRDHRVSIPLSSSLPVGDTSLELTIGRPSSKPEMLSLPIRVPFRIRPDLTPLEGDRPSLLVSIDAMKGSSVFVEGEEVSLEGGFASKSVDVSKDLSGPSFDPAAQLNRRINFSIIPPGGTRENVVVAVSVPVVQLVVDVPGRTVVSEASTFVLAGRTTPGAEIVVAGRSLGVMKEGTFQQTMNISSVGATEIEVRANLSGRAPRLVRVGVERVTSLEEAAIDFEKKSPLNFADFGSDPMAMVGRPAMVKGEIQEVAKTASQTRLTVKVPPSECGDRPPCLVSLMQGRSDLPFEKQRSIRAFGVVRGQFGALPELDVAFSLGLAGTKPAAAPTKPVANPSPSLDGRR